MSIYTTHSHYAIKSTATSRSSTTTPTADPDLQIRLDGYVVYDMTIGLLVTTGSTAAGFQCTMDLTNVYTPGLGVSETIVMNRNDGYLIGDTNNAVLWGAFHTIIIPAGASANYKMTIRGLYCVHTPGTYSLKWAQLVSDPSSTTVSTTSYIRAIPVS